METCKHCGGTNFYETESTPHKGLYCKSCNRFQRWIKQEHNIETGQLASEEQQKYALSLLTKWKHKGEPMTARQAGAIIQAFKV